MKKISFLLVLIFAFTSCRPILYAAYGIKKPKIISKEKLLKRAKKHGLPTDNQYSINQDGLVKYANQGWSTTQLMIYHKSGKFIEPKDSNKCSGVVGVFIDDFTDSTKVNFIDTNATNSYFKYIVDLEGNPVNFKPKTEYFAILFWASFVGRLNKQNTAHWVELIEEKENTEYILVALDPRDFWEETE